MILDVVLEKEILGKELGSVNTEMATKLTVCYFQVNRKSPCFYKAQFFEIAHRHGVPRSFISLAIPSYLDHKFPTRNL